MKTDATNASLAEVRGGLRSSVDPRVAKTRQRISAGVERLSTRGLEVTVSAIVAEAGVSRATFYTHFADLEELALWLQESAFAAIADAALNLEGPDGPTAAMLESQRRLVRHYAEHRTLYSAVFQLPVARGAQGHTAQGMARDIRSHIALRGGPPAGLDADLTALYIANAATGLIVAWVLGEIEADVETLALHLLELMPRWMHRAPDSQGDSLAVWNSERNN
ncbi:TetR/AcrR family transcriptional regulator C-terminal domain-containing protein [Leifsonia kafniensis]|uniref:TetR/AcrR family transcriptional regulator C-terminal domain-containing protein n=1 Tax=Leifsonia kafniensis TaxID=475957 RepID=A0ABP7K1D6_9MICO